MEEIANASLAPEMVKRCNDSLLTTLAALVNASPELGEYGSRGGYGKFEWYSKL